MFEEYVKMAVWNKAAENGKGHGGIMVLVKKKKRSSHLVRKRRLK